MSLRSRVLIGMGVIALVLVGVAVLVTRVTSSYLRERLDDQLGVVARARPAGPPPQGINDGDSTYSSLYVGVVEDGRLREIQRPGFGPSDQPQPDISVEQLVAAADDGESAPFTAPEQGGSGRFRVLAERTPRGDIFVVALSMNEVDAATSQLTRVVVVATLLAIGVLALVAWWVIRLGVRPIKQMTVTASAIADGDLSHRVEPAPAGTEAGKLGHALNTMLGRIETAFAEKEASEDRLRQFVADASHELRTPVTSIRGYAELYQQGALDEAELAQAMRRTEQEAVRMGHLIDDLLLLARLDQGRPLEQAPVDLGQLVEDALLDASAVDQSRPIDADVGEHVIVTGDEHRLRQVVANVVANSLRHTPAGTAIHVRVARTGDRCVFEVRDEGPGMPPEVAQRAFERFYRADPSRARDRGGSGLGLAIVRAIVEAHSGWVALDTAPGAGTTVRIELPSAQVPALSNL